MAKKIPILFTVVIGLILSATYVASGSSISVSQPLQEWPDRSAAVSGPSGPYRTLAAVDPCDVDFDGSGVVDVGDIMLVAGCWHITDGDPSWDPRYDLDGDGIITVVDIMLVAAQWGNPCGTPTPTPTKTPTPTSTPTSTPTGTPTPTPTITPTSTPTPVGPRPPYGVQMFGEVNDADVRNLAQQAGMLWVRLDLHWSTVEPSNDNADPNTWDPSTTNLGAYETQFANASNTGLKVMATIRGNPPWAASTTCGPIDRVGLDEFAEFLQAVVSHYKEPPYNVKHWELYNEPDIQVVSVGENFGGCWGDQGTAYAQMLDVAWEAIHGVDSEAKVLMGAVAYDNFGWYEGGRQVFNPNFMDDVFGYIQSHPLSGRDYFDWMNFHQYDAFRDNWDGGSLPYDQGLLGKAKVIQDKMATYGLNKPLVCSEIGLQVTTPSSQPMSTKLEWQARHIVHEFVRGARLWSDEMKAMILFKMMSLADPSGLDYGVVEEGPPLNPRPAYYAYQTMTEQLEWGMSFDVQLGSGETGSINIQAYRFVMPDGSKKLVLWTDDGQKIKKASDLHIDMAIGPVQLDDTWTGRLSVVDEYGVETVIEDGGPGDRDGVTGTITIQITQAPVYVKAAPLP